jgi:hypothetical protein
MMKGMFLGTFQGMYDMVMTAHAAHVAALCVTAFVVGRFVVGRIGAKALAAGNLSVAIGAYAAVIVLTSIAFILFTSFATTVVWLATINLVTICAASPIMAQYFTIKLAKDSH